MNVTMCQSVGGAAQSGQTVEVSDEYGRWLISMGYGVKNPHGNDADTAKQDPAPHTATGMEQDPEGVSPVAEEPKLKSRKSRLG